MNILFVILSYNRPKVLQECLRSLYENTKIKPTLSYILDDCSEDWMKQALLDAAIKRTKAGTPINVLINNKNLGVGHQFQTAYSLIRQHRPDIACVIESDYIWRNEWLEDVVAVFEASPHTVAIAGMDHADMYQRHKTHGEFCKLMIEQQGKDIEARPFLYQPFNLETSRGPIEVFGVSNSCGCQILHWGRICQFFFENLRMEGAYWRGMDRGFHTDLDRSRASDAHMSGTHTSLWEVYAKKQGIDMTKHFGFLNILPSLSYHSANQGINGKLDPRFFPEGGECFAGVNSGTFPKDYNNWTRQ